LPRSGRVLDVCWVEKEQEMADICVSQENQGDSGLRMGKTEPENGEKAEKTA